MRKAVLLSAMICCLTSAGIAQNMIVAPHGVSPHDAAISEVDIFDHTYNGLLNVGVETQMYLRGVFVDSLLSGAATWTILEKPTSSTATIGVTTVDLDTATQVTVFTPDLVGTYVVEFAEGLFADTVTINAGTYVGIAAGNCALCHDNATYDYKVTEWEGTGHYSIFEDGMNGIASDHYSSSCISCHTTGYDTNADNGGFDDRTQTVDYLEADTTFVFPDSTTLVDVYGGSSDGHLFDGVYDSLLVFFPNSMKLARIQCESCHGPGSAHNGAVTDSKMVSSLDVKNCAICHDEPPRHAKPHEWEASPHAEVPSYPGGSRTTCRGCHNGAQFIQYVEGGEAAITAQPYIPITCATCHEPHSVENEHQVRTVDVTLSNGEVVLAGGTGKLCMNCHQSRQDADTYTNQAASHFGPHYVPQADMLSGTNAVTFGKVPPAKPHLLATENACVDCHMAAADGINAGSHYFTVVDTVAAGSADDVDHVEICATCHPENLTEFSDKTFHDADHDGDGTVEGLQDEVKGLMATLASLLPAAAGHEAYDPHDEVDATWTLAELKSAFNYQMVYYDGSYGIHNPPYTVGILHASIEELTLSGIPGVIVAIDDVPNDQGNMVRIIWEGFGGDGRAIDPVEKYVVKRLDEYAGKDTTWTTVGEVTAHGAARYALDVATLYNTTTAAAFETEFKVVAVTELGDVTESLVGDGESIDNLVPAAPSSVIALVDGGVSLSWEAPGDPDVMGYRIYRSTTPSFTPSAANEIATTANATYVDAVTNPGDYYYKIAAEDFNGNVGGYSTEVSAHITGIDEAGLPMEYALAQNFPNPFNPSTTIKFQLKENGHVTLLIYDHIGREVMRLVDQPMSAGYHSVTVNADRLASGVYFYRIHANDFTAARKMLLLK